MDNAHHRSRVYSVTLALLSRPSASQDPLCGWDVCNSSRKGRNSTGNDLAIPSSCLLTNLDTGVRQVNRSFSGQFCRSLIQVLSYSCIMIAIFAIRNLRPTRILLLYWHSLLLRFPFPRRITKIWVLMVVTSTDAATNMHRLRLVTTHLSVS